MEKKAKTIFCLSRQLALVSVTGFALACLALPVWASGGAIQNIQYITGTKHLIIDSTGPVKAMVNTVNIAGHKRVIVDVDNAEIATSLPRDSQLLQALSSQLPGLRNITVNQYGGNGRPVVRIVFDLDNDSKIIRLVQNQGLRLELEVADNILAQSPPRPSSQSTAASADINQQTVKTLDEQRKQIAALQQQINQLRTQTMNTTAQTASGEPALHAEIVRLKAANASLQNQLNTTGTHTTPTTKNPSSDLELQLLDSKRKIDRLALEKQQLQTQLNLTKPQNGPSLDEMKRTLVTMNQRYDQLTAENHNLKSQLLTAPEPTKTSTSDNVLAVKQAEIDRLNKDMQTLRKQMQTQNTQPNASVEDMKHTLVVMNQRYNQLVAENQKLVDANTALQVQPKTTPATPDLQSLRQQLTQAQQSLNSSIGTINEQNKEIAYLRNQVNDVKAGMDVSSRTQLSQLRAERDEKDAHIRQLEQQLAAKSGSSQTAGSQAEVATLKRQLEQVTSQYRTTVDDLSRQLNSKGQQVQERENQLNAARDASQQHSAEQQAQIASLQTQLDDAQQKTAGSTAAIAQNQQRDTQAINALKAQLQKQQNDATALKTELDALKRSNGSSGQATAALKSELSKISQENQGLKTTIANLQAKHGNADASMKNQLDQLTQENHELKNTVSNLQTQNNESGALQTQMTQLAQENQDLKERLAAQPQPQTVDANVLKDEIARLTEENQSIKAKMASGTGGDTQLKNQLASLQTQVGSLKSQYEKAANDAKQAKLELASQKKVMMATKPAAGSGSTVLQKQVADLNRQLVTLRDENSTLREKAGDNKQPASSNPEAEQNYQEAKAALTAGNLESSLEKFKAAQLMEPDNSRYNIDYSVALAQDHEYAEASDLLRRYLQRNPADREAYGQLGKIYLLNDQTDMAAQALSRAIPIGTLNNYATALKKAGKNDDAENIFKMALKLNPNDSEVLFNLGNLYNATERLELARNSYLQAIQVKPDFAEAYYNLGLIYSKLNDRAKAVTYLEKFLQLSPNARNADTIRAYVEKLKA